MKKSLILSALMLSLGLSTSAFAATTMVKYEPAVVVDPITGLVQGTTTWVNGVTNTTLGIVPVTTTNNRYMVRENYGTGRVIMDNGTPYVISNGNNVRDPAMNGIGYGTVLTNMNTGKSYVVTGMKQGTMDVINGNRTLRYQYVTPMVKPL